MVLGESDTTQCKTGRLEPFVPTAPVLSHFSATCTWNYINSLSCLGLDSPFHAHVSTQRGDSPAAPPTGELEREAVKGLGSAHQSCHWTEQSLWLPNSFPTSSPALPLSAQGGTQCSVLHKSSASPSNSWNSVDALWSKLCPPELSVIAHNKPR